MLPKEYIVTEFSSLEERNDVYQNYYSDKDYVTEVAWKYIICSKWSTDDSSGIGKSTSINHTIYNEVSHLPVLTYEQWKEMKESEIDFTIKGTKLPDVKGIKFRFVNWDKYDDVESLPGVCDNYYSFGSTTYNNEVWVLFDYKDYDGTNYYMAKLSDIQQRAIEQGMIKEFEKSDEFKLPKKWKVKINSTDQIEEYLIEKYDRIESWCKQSINYFLYSDKLTEYACPEYVSIANNPNYTEITFEQFKKYVLKEEVFLEKFCFRGCKEANEWQRTELENKTNVHMNYEKYFYYHELTGKYNDEEWRFFDNLPEGYTEVTFEQFTKYVLNKEKMNKFDCTIEGNFNLIKAFIADSGIDYLSHWDILKSNLQRWPYLVMGSTRKWKTTMIKNNNHFILPQQYEEALAYIKKASEVVKTFKLGGYKAVVKNGEISIKDKGVGTVKEFNEFMEDVLNLKNKDLANTIGGYNLRFNEIADNQEFSVGCVKNIPFKDMKAMYEYTKTL